MLKLHQYQKDILNILSTGDSAGLILEPGLGKTIISLSHIATKKAKNPSYKTLIIAPLRVIYSTWPNEIQKWDEFNHLKHFLFHGKQKKVESIDEYDIVLLNPDGLVDFFNKFGGVKFDLLIVDESTQFKKPSTKRFKILRRFLKKFKQSIILTGTPIPNGYLDLWSQMFILDQGKRLGAYYGHYKTRYFVQHQYIKYKWDIRDKKHQQMIDDLASELCISIKSKDVIDIPNKINSIEYNLMTPELYKRYKVLNKKFVIELDNKDLLAPNVLVKLIKCQQFSNGCIYDEEKKPVEIHLGKIEVLKQLIEDLNGENLLVFYCFNSDLEMFKKHIDKDAPIINGKMSAEQSASVVNKWNNKEIKLLFAQPAAMSHGLNMQSGGNHVAWFGLSYNLELYQQANARLHRQNQKNSVVIHHLVTKDTIDEQILKVLNIKDVDQSSLLKSLKLNIGNK